jgi:hypothetical protein
MERVQQPSRGFTLAEAVELLRRISAANDDHDRVHNPRPPVGGDGSTSAFGGEARQPAA